MTDDNFVNSQPKLKIKLPSLKDRLHSQISTSVQSSTWPSPTASTSSHLPDDLFLPFDKGKKRTKKAKWDTVTQSRGPPRPLKLKPLKEVLQRLIVLIQKRDSYAFFMEPVKAELVPGYHEIIEYPMDFGTMVHKIDNNRYRSIEEFETDFQLVMSNAKLFNAPGTLPYSEATRIEAWTLDAITRAKPTIIQYETVDWNMDVDIENDGIQENENELNSVADGTPAPDGNRGTLPPRKSASSSHNSIAPVRSLLEVEGPYIPGTEAGIGIFPVGSDLARIMVELKLRDKKYKTKKERMRIDRWGLPFCSDGSLNYREIEDPFSILSALVPVDERHFELYDIASKSSTPSASAENKPTVKKSAVLPSKRKHWAIYYAGTWNTRKEEDSVFSSEPVFRKPLNLDFGVYPELELLGDSALPVKIQRQVPATEDLRFFFTRKRAVEAEAYLKQEVYGGELGYAYTRSMAEFVHPRISKASDTYPLPKPLGMSLRDYVRTKTLCELTNGLHAYIKPGSTSSTGLKIEQNLHILQVLAQSSMKIDVSSLIRDPNDLIKADNLWAGRASDHDQELKEDWAFALDYAADLICGISDSLAAEPTMKLKIESQDNNKRKANEEATKADLSERMTDVRMNLLALAKRAPLHTLAPIREDLVPNFLREALIPILKT